MPKRFLISYALAILLATTVILIFMVINVFQSGTKQPLRIGEIESYTFRYTESLSRCNTSIRASKSAWFKSKFNKNVSPFWTSSNKEIEKGTYSWWLRIQNQWQWLYPISATYNLLEELFKYGVPNKQDFTETRMKGCLTCAVVGNSQNLIGSDYGSVIDGHDIVIRFNKAVTKGFEKDVGSKTTHHFGYPESAKEKISKETSFTLIPFKPPDVQWLLSVITTRHKKYMYQSVPKLVSCNISKIAIIQPSFIRYVHQNWLDGHGRYTSTGVVGVAMAIQICDDIDVYGFGANKIGVWQHYWEVLTEAFVSSFRQDVVHDLDKEKVWLEKLSTEGIINLHRGA